MKSFHWAWPTDNNVDNTGQNPQSQFKIQKVVKTKYFCNLMQIHLITKSDLRLLIIFLTLT